MAGREIVKLSGQKEGTLLEMMRLRLKEASGTVTLADVAAPAARRLIRIEREQVQ